jgi:hypothetical protein
LPGISLVGSDKIEYDMGLFDVLKNFDPDAIVKGIDGLEQAIGQVVDGVDGATAKVEDTARIVEEKLTQPNEASAGDIPISTVSND